MRRPMSGFGTKRTSERRQLMSGIGGKADIGWLAAPAKYDKYQDLYCQKLKLYVCNKRTLRSV